MNIFYGIQQISTGKLLPAPSGRGGRGGTRVEFTDPGSPRLFKKQGSANTALRWWLRGMVFVSQHESYDGYWDESWTVEKQAHRLASDTRVVSIYLTPFPPTHSL
jgi:hypothetical protein